MKRKLLTLSCTIILCLSLSSCGLKNAITGNNSDNTDEPKTIEATPETTDDKKDDITNDASTETTNETSTTDDAVLANNNEFLQTEDSSTSSTSADTPSLSPTTNTVNRDCRVFYFNKADLKTYCTDTSVAVTDNAFVTALTEKLYSAPNNNSNFITISKDFGVKSATLNYDTNILTVVFNSNFIDDLKLDSENSLGLMKAIVNTYGYNYGVDKVAVYFGNQLYTGIEGTSDAGYSTVNYTDALKLD